MESPERPRTIRGRIKKFLSAVVSSTPLPILEHPVHENLNVRCLLWYFVGVGVPVFRAEGVAW